ncbi:Fe-S protein [Vibrio crassostreae ZF-91]|nr:Fe-S protein [Vibrio crassostreae ZF-91]
MEQLEFFQVPSPCVGVCSSDDKGYCNGCMRKREERFNWMSMTPSEQLHVIKLCRQRYRRKIMNQKNLIGKQVDDEGNTSPQRDLFG